VGPHSDVRVPPMLVPPWEEDAAPLPRGAEPGGRALAEPGDTIRRAPERGGYTMVASAARPAELGRTAYAPGMEAMGLA
jgi:hypothetical protein